MKKSDLDRLEAIFEKLANLPPESHGATCMFKDEKGGIYLISYSPEKDFEKWQEHLPALEKIAEKVVY